MRAIVLASFATLGLMTMPVFAGSKKLHAHVELISFPGRAQALSPDSTADAAAGAGEATALPVGFQAHDLSRKYVEYRMASELSAPADPAAPDTSPAEPPQSSIMIPNWMRAGQPNYASPMQMPGACGGTVYRPTGFLPPAAEYRRAGMFRMMSDIACQYGIPVGLFDAMIIRESRYQANIFSPKNAYGLTQLMPATAADLGVNRYDPVDNLRGGARYLRSQIDRFGHVHLALAAYNAGPSRIRGDQIPSITETRNYVADILLNWRRLTEDRHVSIVDYSRPTSPVQEVRPPKSRIAAVSLF